MIAGIGVDIVEISRIKNALTRWKDAFLRRIFTENEINYSRGKKSSYQHFAARFAAKEAVLKAIGDSSIQRVEWHNIEVLNDEFGKPTIRLSGEAKRIKEDRNISEIIISMSHTRTYAVANAILLRRPDYIVGGRSSGLRRSVGTKKENKPLALAIGVSLKDDKG